LTWSHTLVNIEDSHNFGFGLLFKKVTIGRLVAIVFPSSPEDPFWEAP
jgi:hypothetical protein